MLCFAADEQMKKCMELEEKLKTMDREISVNPQYVQKVETSFVFCVKCYILVICTYVSAILCCERKKPMPHLFF